MRLKKTVAVALATALLASVAAVPAFATTTNGYNTVTVKESVDTTANPSGFSKEVTGDKDPSTTQPQDTEDAKKETSIGKTTVKYYVTETYTWTIPSVIDFKSDADVGKTVTVSTEAAGDLKYQNENSKVVVKDNVIPEGKTLKIKVSGANNDASGQYRLLNGTKTYLNYSITKATGNAKLGNDAEVVSVAAGTDGVTENLKFELSTQIDSNTSEISGAYKDTLTFTATVENQTQSNG